MPTLTALLSQAAAEYVSLMLRDAWWALSYGASDLWRWALRHPWEIAAGTIVLFILWRLIRPR